VSNLTIRPLAESGLLVEMGDAIDAPTVGRVAALTALLDEAALPGVLDIVPSYTTLLMDFDPERTDQAIVSAEVERLCRELTKHDPPPSRAVTIPVAYGGDLGPDLPGVATHTGFSPDEVIARHAGGEYLVAFMGFAPGFAFLSGLPPDLATPRIAPPRTRVPIGSVGIGGGQTGIYPLVTPGGWRLIGRTPLRLFALEREEPFLLAPGDAVRFEPISRDEYRTIEARELADS